MPGLAFRALGVKRGNQDRTSEASKALARGFVGSRPRFSASRLACDLSRDREEQELGRERHRSRKKESFYGANSGGSAMAVDSVRIVLAPDYGYFL